MLSDELLSIGMSINLDSDDSINDSINRMFTMAYNDTIEKIGQFKDDKTIISCFRRTNWIWNDLREKLNNAGIAVLSENGFKNVVISMSDNACQLFGESCDK
jgi:hypothetical protein